MKKIISLILSLTLILGCTAGITVSADASGVTDTDEALALLTYMGMAEADDNLSENITRAEFASLVAKAIKAQASSGKQYFTDVAAEFWAFDAISALTELGYISGGDNMAFRPDDSIRLSEAAKIVVFMLGYGELSSAKGGWSAGYLQTASRLGITQGISSEYITREQAYVMLMRAMNEPLYVPSIISDKGTRYEVDETSTILSLYHDIYYIEDTVNAAGPVSLSTSSQVSEGEALIGNKTFRTDEISADMYEYLGMTIIGYYTETDGKNASLVVALPLGEENTVITVSKEDVTSIEDKGGYYLFEYYDEDERKEDVKVPRGAVVVKNGMNVTSDLFKSFAIDKGSYKFLDHNDDGKIDVAFVNEYYNLVVGLIENKEGMTYISTDSQGYIEYWRGNVGSKQVIYDKFDSTLSVDITDENNKIVKLKNANGTICTINDIALGEVLSVYKSANEKYVEVVKGSGAINGAVEELSYPDKDTIILTINGTEYKMDASVASSSPDKLNVGLNATFYIDAFGYIGFYSASNDSAIIFGYLTEVGRKQSGLDKTVYLRIFGADGIFDTYTLSEKAIEDGKKITNLDSAYTSLSTHTKQMIRFSKNEAKEVTFIDTLHKNVSAEGEKSITETLAFGSYLNSSAIGSFHQKLCFKGATPVLVVPNDGTIDSGNYDETHFTIMKKSDLTTDSNAYISSYRVNPDAGFEDIILAKREKVKVMSRPLMIDEVKTVMNDEGDTVNEIIAYSNSDLPQKYITEDSSALKGYTLNRGDIVWFEQNLENEIVSVIDVIVKAGDEPTFKISNSEGPQARYYSKSGGGSKPSGRTEIKNATSTSSFCLHFGYAKEMADGVIRFAHTKEECAADDYTLARNLSSQKIIVYDRESGREGRIYWTSAADIIDYKKAGDSCSDVFLFMKQNRLQAVFVYK